MLEPEPLDQSLALVQTAQEDHHLSLNALNEGTCVGVIQFSTQVNNFTIKVLMDGGSSDNFIQPRVAKFLKLPIETTLSLKVMVGNGIYVSAEGFVSNISLLVQEVKLKIHTFVLPIFTTYIILGTKWLATLGLHLADC